MWNADSILIFKDEKIFRLASNGSISATTKKQVTFNIQDGSLAIETYTVGPRGGLTSSAVSVFSKEDFELIMYRYTLIREKVYFANPQSEDLAILKNYFYPEGT